MAGPETPSAEARIPAAATAVVDLLNSRPHATPQLPDTLDSPETAVAILGPFGQPDGEPPSPERVERIRALRRGLMAVVAEAGSAEVAQGWTDVTEQASSAVFRQVFSVPGQVQLEQVAGDPVVGAVTLTVAEMVAANTWSRIRVCANGLCNHVFYDMTRSRTQRWHSYETCGNRNNVAAYRAARKKATSGSE